MIRPGKAGERNGQYVAALNGLHWFLGLLAAAAGASTKTNLANYFGLPPWATPYVTWIASNAWWLVVVFTALALCSKWLASHLEKAWVWEAVQTLLDQVCTSAFGTLAGQPFHHHRATLFQYKRRLYWLWPFRKSRFRWWPWGHKCWPSSGWLVPVLRSNHTSKKTSTLFLAPDNADRAEGIVGRIWAQGKALEVKVDVPAKSVTQAWNAALKRKYEKTTYLPNDWLDERSTDCSTLALAFWGIPIELKGRRWGVLLLDSRKKDGINLSKLDELLYARMFDKLIQRI